MEEPTGASVLPVAATQVIASSSKRSLDDSNLNFDTTSAKRRVTTRARAYVITSSEEDEEEDDDIVVQWDDRSYNTWQHFVKMEGRVSRQSRGPNSFVVL